MMKGGSVPEVVELAGSYLDNHVKGVSGVGWLQLMRITRETPHRLSNLLK